MNLKNAANGLKKNLHFDFIHLKECLSTQDSALEYSLSNQQAALVIADNQTKGRGRRGREWSGHPDKSLLLSLSFPTNALMLEKSLLSLYAGAVLYCTLCGFNKKFASLTLKWPNDLGLYQNSQFKKVAGILIEVKKDYFLVGVGINIAGLAPWEGALSLSDLDPKISLNKKQFAKTFAHNFFTALAAQSENTDSLLEFLHNKAMSSLWGKKLSSHWQNHFACGLAGDGALITCAPKGSVHCIYSGDI